MIVRIQRGKSGYSQYLITGNKKDSKYTRNEKDNVVPLYGCLDIFKKTEEFLNKEKNYKDNYLMIVVSFSKDDINKMKDMSDDEVSEMKKDIVETYIKHHTSGYDLDNEVIAYAEEHQPKIKVDEKGNERYNHIHIGISLYNPLSDTKLRTTFHNNSFIDDTLQAYINKKYGLSQPREHKRKRQGTEADTQIARDRKYYKEELKYIKSNNELLQYFNDNNILYREVKTKSNHYYKIVNNNGKDINLKGKDFEHIHKVTLDKDFKYNEHKDLKELEEVLSNYYHKRIVEIDKRRSKITKEVLEDIYKHSSNKIDNKKNKIFIELTYQQKIFYKYYNHLLDENLRGYYVDVKEDKTRFINNNKNIDIEDNGDEIVSNSIGNKNLQEEVRLMLDIAEAKEWTLCTLEIQGNDEFVQEVKKQIAKRLREKEQLEKKTLSFTELEVIKQKIYERPTSVVQVYKKIELEEQENEKINNNISLTMLKQNLKASNVLAYAVEKYKLNANDFKLTDDNKINNINNRQKPKNIIDFLQKEINLSSREAINICQDLYKYQPLNIEVDKKQQKEIKTMPLNISISDDKTKDKNGKILALNKWKTVEVNSYIELATLMKTNSYSMVEYGDKLTKKNNQRNNNNIKCFNNVLIYDIDNDIDTSQLSIKEAKELLKSHNISAMILPSKSHQIEKFTDSGKSKGIKDRYRIIIPLNKKLSFTDTDTYKEFQKITTKALKLDEFIDKGISQNPSTFYYQSPIEAVPHIIKSDRVMNIDKLEEKAISNIKAKELKRQQEQQKASEIRANINQYQKATKVSSNNLTYANIDKIMQLDIKQLINYFEKDNKQYKEGSYDMIKTNNAKYSVIDSNVVHDFKNDITYNSLTYLQYKIGTTNLNRLAIELENITGDNFIELNIDRIKEVIQQARDEAINDKSFEEYIKNSFNVRYCKLNKDSIIIANKEILLSDIQHSKQDIVRDLQNNREKNNEQNKRNVQMSR